MHCLHLCPHFPALHVHERAEGDPGGRPTLVFLHYFGGSGCSWEAVVEILAREGYRCLAPDLRGFGQSEAPGEEPIFYTVGTMACDVHQLVNRLGLQRFVLIGHSMGGKVALALAARRPVGLEAVVLLAPSPPTPEPMDGAERARLLAAHGDPEAVAATLQRIAARPLLKPSFERAAADSLRASAPAWRAWLERGSREDISASLREVQTPVFVAVGSADDTITGSLVEREIAVRLRLPTLIRVLPGTGHLLPLEAPAATADFIREAVARL